MKIALKSATHPIRLMPPIESIKNIVNGIDKKIRSQIFIMKALFVGSDLMLKLRSLG